MSYTLPEPVNEYLANDISAVDVMYRGDPSYEHDGYHMRSAIEKMVRNGYAIYTAAEVQAAFDAGRASRDAEVEALRAERDCAIAMLAEWCVDVDMGGSGWDCWDEHYKTAMYRPNPIRNLLDQAIDAARKEKQA